MDFYQTTSYQSNGHLDEKRKSRRKSTQSDENSDEFQRVAEEDVGSFIKHRNEYLDGDI